MNKNYKRILASGLVATMFASLSVGTTFALFTDRDDAAINVGSGKISASVAIAETGFQTYSVLANENGDRVDENNHHYFSEETEVNGVFTNGGTAVRESSSITLGNITPGDRVTFNLSFADDSNVDYKYRFAYQLVSQDKTLATGLVTKTNLGGEEQTYEGLLELVSSWHRASETALTDNNISFDVELPVFKGNAYQDKEAQFIITLETVQANAYVDNSGAKKACGLEDFRQEAVADGDDVSLTATSLDQSISVKTVIPASEVELDDTVELVVSGVSIDSDLGGSTTLCFDATLYVNGSETSSFDEEINVEIYIGEDLQVDHLYHNDQEITNFTYDSDTGIVSFSTSSFSPFTLEISVPVSAGGQDMEDSEEDNE